MMALGGALGEAAETLPAERVSQHKWNAGAAQGEKGGPEAEIACGLSVVESSLAGRRGQASQSLQAAKFALAGTIHDDLTGTSILQDTPSVANTRSTIPPSS